MFVIGAAIAAMLLPISPAMAEQAKEKDAMILYRNDTRPSQKGPAEWFTGSVRIDPLNTAPASRVTAQRA